MMALGFFVFSERKTVPYGVKRIAFSCGNGKFSLEAVPKRNALMKNHQGACF